MSISRYHGFPSSFLPQASIDTDFCSFSLLHLSMHLVFWMKDENSPSWRSCSLLGKCPLQTFAPVKWWVLNSGWGRRQEGEERSAINLEWNHRTYAFKWTLFSKKSLWKKEYISQLCSSHLKYFRLSSWSYLQRIFASYTKNLIVFYFYQIILTSSVLSKMFFFV